MHSLMLKDCCHVSAVLLLSHPVVAPAVVSGGGLQRQNCGIRLGQDVSLCQLTSAPACVLAVAAGC